ncbi:MAG: hypothetical protein MUP45_03820 [Candidatus Marinimicrobia bacterium]|nr:hypothetical protein [Candidatus Neomarinimicrobiota bacterium]
MQEKWRGDGSAESGAEELALTRKLRENWKILEGDGTGITIYETPSGIFKAEEEPDGTLIRLERIENYQSC